MVKMRNLLALRTCSSAPKFTLKALHLKTALILIALSFPGIALGQGQIRDANTIVVSGTPVRPNGVDAPEPGTSAERDARRWMPNHLAGSSIECDLNGERAHDRWVGIIDKTVDRPTLNTLSSLGFGISDSDV